MKCRATAVSFLLLSVLATPSQASRIANGSFEQVPSSSTGEGLFPSGWFHMNPSPPASSRASTFSTDGSSGLAPGGNGNFSGVTAAEGSRWVAGETGYAHGPTNLTVEGEAFGIALTQLLVPGGSHQVDADVRRLRYGSVLGPYNPEGPRLFLSPEYRGAGAALLGLIEVTTSVGRQSAC